MVKQRFIFIILLSSILVIIGSSPLIALDIQYTNKIDVKEMSFQWKIDGDRIHIKLVAKTTGWVGIGFNPSKFMKDANFILGYVKDGKPALTDHFGTGERKHEGDKKLGGKSNISNIFGKEENGETEIGFTFPLNSKDPNDREIEVDQDTMILLAYGAGRDSFRSLHKFRTKLTVNLTSGKYKKD
jgi:hypothetical protein